ncbi:uncharacterized protein LOC131002331 isoform X1 [Salvia miltiorrhiza]|uniref:uncharacterized protein LOC131002331 isoform X1 n=1 Tax=Salvia miltiorrhiza TaxID=226208 RepID=UPI0025AC45A5|nr:uncharacterized protein LOC131002331 isoform X1 [Salvia miltiorrhiza]
MALLLSVSFSMPHCHRQTQFQASHSSRLTGGRLLNSLTSRTVKRHLSPKYSGGGVISLNESHRCNSRQWLEPVLCDVGVCCCVNVQISGYWMGPDVEDGWGFVEASVLILASSHSGHMW